MQDKTVLVTGATRGLGLATARRLAQDGFTVVGVGRQRRAGFDDLVAMGNGRVHFVTYDLEEVGGIHDFVKGVQAEHGPLYGLVNNAAIGTAGLLATMHARDIERVIRINLQAPIELIKFGSRSMILQREGRIVNVTSVIAVTGYSGLSVYAATKGGLEGLTKSLARELGRVGITVNCVAPGYMETDMTVSLQGDKLESVRRRSPLGLAQPADAAGAISYLIGPDAQRITGTVVIVDGGGRA